MALVKKNIIGHLLLNTTMYPTAAVVILAYSLRKVWISVVVIIFVLIEFLFIRLGIYEQHWWRYYMLVITVVAFILISRYWFLKMNQKGGLTRGLRFYLIAIIIIHTYAPVLLLLGKQYYQLSFINSELLR